MKPMGFLQEKSQEPKAQPQRNNSDQSEKLRRQTHPTTAETIQILYEQQDTPNI